MVGFRLTLTIISAIIVGAAAFAGVARYTERAFGVVPVTPYEADVNKDTRVNAIDLGQVAQKFGQPVPTATPNASRDLILVEYATPPVGQTWFGAYRPDRCSEAVISVHATSNTSSGAPVFDFLIARSVDGVTPAAIANIGNSSSIGYAGTWHTHRKVSYNTSGAVQGGGNIEPYGYHDDIQPAYPFMMVGAFVMDPGIFTVEVHCSRELF